MANRQLQQVVRLLAAALILKVTSSIILNYDRYVPPSFESGFLYRRQSYFWNGYQFAFYTHITVAPFTLISGMVLMSDRFRLRLPTCHRYLGTIQVACILLFVVPSGVWMSIYARTGAVAGLGFAMLGAATALSALLGWRAVVRKQLAAHRCWMSRCFLLLCSTVVLRLIGGAFTVIGVYAEWTYSLAAWMSWLVPLAVFELLRRSYKVTEFATEQRLQLSR